MVVCGIALATGHKPAFFIFLGVLFYVFVCLAFCMLLGGVFA